MIRLARFGWRLGLRWFVVTALGRMVVRRFGRAMVDRATDEVESAARRRLPPPVADAVSSLPVEARRAAGSALVAGRAARGGLRASRRAGGLAAAGTRLAASGARLTASGARSAVVRPRRAGGRAGKEDGVAGRPG